MLKKPKQNNILRFVVPLFWLKHIFKLTQILLIINKIFAGVLENWITISNFSNTYVILTVDVDVTAVQNKMKFNSLNMYLTRFVFTRQPLMQIR